MKYKFIKGTLLIPYKEFITQELWDKNVSGIVDFMFEDIGDITVKVGANEKDGKLYAEFELRANTFTACNAYLIELKATIRKYFKGKIEDVFIVKGKRL
jgi:hypothetical protein